MEYNLSTLCTVPPAYYAHLAAYRARFYMEPDVHEIAKSRGARSKDESVRPLPALKEKVKSVMFYCWKTSTRETAAYVGKGNWN